MAIKNRNIIPDRKKSQDNIVIDKKLKNFVKLSEYAAKSKKEGYIIESFIIVYQIMQEMFLLELRRRTLVALGLRKLEKKFSKQQNSYNINLEYVALTHDIELFELLEKTRKIRNELIHKLSSDESFNVSKQKAAKAYKLVQKLVGEISKRLKGTKPIPVLNLYPKGWNDCRAQSIKNFGFEEKNDKNNKSN